MDKTYCPRIQHCKSDMITITTSKIIITVITTDYIPIFILCYTWPDFYVSPLYLWIIDVPDNVRMSYNNNNMTFLIHLTLTLNLPPLLLLTSSIVIHSTQWRRTTRIWCLWRKRNRQRHITLYNDTDRANEKKVVLITRQILVHFPLNVSITSNPLSCYNYNSNNLHTQAFLWVSREYLERYLIQRNAV